MMTVPAQNDFGREFKAFRFGWPLLMCCVLPAYAQTDVALKPMSGPGGGGTPFHARCPQGELLTGLDIWAGEDIDAVRPLCVPAMAGQFKAYPSKFGGPGGSLRQLVCPNETPIVIGMDIGWEGKEIYTVNNIHLYCGLAVATPQRFPFPAAVFDAPPAKRGGVFATYIGVGDEQQRCPPGLVAVGINGRAHDRWVHAIGMICGAALAPNTVKPGGRVNVGTGPTAPARPICDVATEARARNSPAAPGLEEKCRTERAAQATVVDQVTGARDSVRIGETVSLNPQPLPPGPDPYEQAQPGASVPAAGTNAGIIIVSGKDGGPPVLKSTRMIPNAASGVDPGLASVAIALAKATQAELDALAARGPTIAARDPLAMELRAKQNAAGVRGFDIGMAASEGQTAPGPGKDQIRNSLPANEQGGFIWAVAFSLDRNRNAEWAAKGAAIAAVDADVAPARRALPDPLYRLGFDIATGIFGDPALGAQGNTATGPGSTAIRNALSPSAMQGFDEGMKFHLRRTYPR